MSTSVTLVTRSQTCLLMLLTVDETHRYPFSLRNCHVVFWKLLMLPLRSFLREPSRLLFLEKVDDDEPESQWGPTSKVISFETKRNANKLIPKKASLCFPGS